MHEWVNELLAGNRRTLARLLTAVENESEGAAAALAALYPHTGRAWVVGVTGSPGTGKSSLVAALARHLRAAGATVGILAVDPTSPFTGGAILGDRIRMRDLAGDPGVFIRSMATRGSLGGLARAVHDAIRVMDAAGFTYILVETVGAGQSEVDIVKAAHTTIVIEAPGLGDDVQAIKAGILEIADVLVVNKADRPGADSTARALKAMLELGHPVLRVGFVGHHGRALHAPAPPTAVDPTAPIWIPPVLRTVATERQGIAELVEAIARHRAFLSADGRLQQLEADHIRAELLERAQEALLEQFLARMTPAGLEAFVQAVQDRQQAPQAAIQEMLARYPTPVAQ